VPEWISQALASPSITPTVLAAAFALGIVGAVTNCCNLPVIGAIAGYSGSLAGKGLPGGSQRRAVIAGALSFMLGTAVALAVIGAAAGLLSQTLGAALGKYWRIFAGLIMVLLGSATLGLVPLKIPTPGILRGDAPVGPRQAMLAGFAIGGGVTVCSAGCNPALFLVIGMATLHAHAAAGAALLAAFAIGYGLPLAGALIGVGLGVEKLSAAVRKAAPAIRVTAGVLLIGVGFYLLAFGGR
jgi:cytochrome c biogenesis protein CcdA